MFGHAGSPAQAILAAIAMRCSGTGTVPRDGHAYARLAAEFGAALPAAVARCVTTLAELLARGERLLREFEHPELPVSARADVASQLAVLLGPGQIARVVAGAEQRHARYLSGVERRLDHLRAHPGRDAQRMARLTPLWHDFLRASAAPDDAERVRLLYLFEDWRMALFAPELAGAAPVAATTLREALARWRPDGVSATDRDARDTHIVAAPRSAC
jgi:ATP-dependent helicase HrpA